MRMYILLAISALFLFSSCKKDKSTSENKKETTNYMNVVPGSSWHYQEINASGTAPVQSDYTVTSTNRDTTISNKSYHIFTISYGGSRYLNVSGKDYYEFGAFPGAGINSFERLYLKGGATVGTSWSQSEKLMVEGVQIPIKLTNTILSNSLIKMIHGKSYEKVIHVKTTITSELIPAASLITDIHSYFSPNYGIVENTTKINLNYLGVVEKVDISTTLKSTILK